jgi:hypothetical protein
MDYSNVLDRIAEAAPMANVYMFNTYNNQANLNLNTWGLPNPLAAAAPPNYTPTSTNRPRNPSKGNPGIAQFGAQNTLIVAFGTLDSPDATYSYEIDGISYEDVPSSQDLQLYIFYNTIVLVKQSEAGPVIYQGEQASPEQIKHVGTAPTAPPEHEQEVVETEGGGSN